MFLSMFAIKEFSFAVPENQIGEENQHLMSIRHSVWSFIFSTYFINANLIFKTLVKNY